MFRKPKIKAITSCVSGESLFVFGKARNGNVYIWRSDIGKWQLYVNPPVAAQDGSGPK